MARRSIQRTVTGRTPLTSFRSLLAAVALLAPFLLLGSCTNAFSISSSTVSRTRTPSCGARPAGAPSRCLAPSTRRGILQPTAFQGVYNMKFQSQKLRPSSTTTLSMYKLPPGGGGGGAKNDIAEIAKGAVSLLLVIGFFVSPLGGFVLSIFNSFLLLLFVLPLLATVGFQAWSSLNTVKGECPNCGAPAQVMKNQDSGSNVVDDFGPAQSICFNCGAILQANEDNSGINNVSGRTSLDDLDSQMGGASLFDLFSSTTSTTTTPTSTTTTTSPNKVDKGSVIDVDVLDEDKPFQ